MKHALVGVLFPSAAPDDPVFACACGALVSGVRPGIWRVTRGPAGASFWPSVDVPGHFHAFYNDVKTVSTMGELVALTDPGGARCPSG